MPDQFDQLQSPEALREECRSLLAQLQLTQAGCKNARIDELNILYKEFFGGEFGIGVAICDEDVADYIERRKRELSV